MQLVDADAHVVVRYWPAAHDGHVTVDGRQALVSRVKLTRESTLVTVAYTE
jgi:hypothetical protein